MCSFHVREPLGHSRQAQHTQAPSTHRYTHMGTHSFLRAATRTGTHLHNTRNSPGAESPIKLLWMVAGFTWRTYHPRDVRPRCQGAMVQTGRCQCQVSMRSAGQLTDGCDPAETSENSNISSPSKPFPFPQKFQGILWVTVKDSRLEGPAANTYRWRQV